MDGGMFLNKRLKGSSWWYSWPYHLRLCYLFKCRFNIRLYCLKDVVNGVEIVLITAPPQKHFTCIIRVCQWDVLLIHEIWELFRERNGFCVVFLVSDRVKESQWMQCGARVDQFKMSYVIRWLTPLEWIKILVKRAAGGLNKMEM